MTPEIYRVIAYDADKSPELGENDEIGTWDYHQVTPPALEFGDRFMAHLRDNVYATGIVMRRSVLLLANKKGIVVAYMLRNVQEVDGRHYSICNY